MPRRAVIDIGTNSVKLLVGDVSDALITPVHEASKQTRLGAGFYDTHLLKREPIQKTASAVATFATQAREKGATSVLVIATSAARDARNAPELLDAIEQSANLPVRILTGDEEAEWVFGGVMTDPQFANQPVFIMDVGGGSTEIILGENRHKSWAGSFNIGVVRLLEQLQPSDPPGIAALQTCRKSVREFLANQVTPKINNPNAPKQRRLIGVGGTATILARVEQQLDTFDRERIESARVALSKLRPDLEALWQKPLAEREHVIGIQRNRADVILTGMAIFEAVMDQFGFDEVRVSTRGLRYHALLQ
jgi:exopolyphosphatase / guanosine-5'-triphosphate,3'-diphosphate pyrophosphatase